MKPEPNKTPIKDAFAVYLKAYQQGEEIPERHITHLYQTFFAGFASCFILLIKQGGKGVTQEENLAYFDAIKDEINERDARVKAATKNPVKVEL